jgi:large subunit ribosomal protein L11
MIETMTDRTMVTDGIHVCNGCFCNSRASFPFAQQPAAKPGPAIGQALGPLGINMAQFCKDFNEKSGEIYEKDTPLRVELRAMSDRSYTFAIRSPPTSWLVKRAAGMTKGPSAPNSADEISGYITPEMVHYIALIKQGDDNTWHLPLKGLARQVVGTAKSMGVIVAEEENIP